MNSFRDIMGGFARPLPADRLPERAALRLGDGYETYVYVHQARGSQRRLPVLYVHGIQSHPGWFVGSAAALADAGHPVFQVARRGSGENQFARGDAPSADQLLRDVESACRLAVESTGSSRLHLLGVSWGGKLLCAFAAREAERPSGIDIASLTLVAPGIVPRVDVCLLTKAAIAACLLLRPARMFGIPLSDVELFTDNESMRAYLRGDPFRLHRATARFLYAGRCLDALLQRALAGILRPPVTLILSARDRIIDNPKTRRAVARLTGGRAVAEELDGAHTLEFEADPEPFHHTLLAAVSRGQGGATGTGNR